MRGGVVVVLVPPPLLPEVVEVEPLEAGGGAVVEVDVPPPLCVPEVLPLVLAPGAGVVTEPLALPETEAPPEGVPEPPLCVALPEPAGGVEVDVDELELEPLGGGGVTAPLVDVLELLAPEGVLGAGAVVPLPETLLDPLPAGAGAVVVLPPDVVVELLLLLVPLSPHPTNVMRLTRAVAARNLVFIRILLAVVVFRTHARAIQVPQPRQRRDRGRNSRWGCQRCGLAKGCSTSSLRREIPSPTPLIPS